MSVPIEQLNKEWEDLREDLNKKQKKFDDKYREKNKDHNCDTKVFSHNGEWFCRHLTMARYNHLKEDIKKEDKIISSIVGIAD